MLDRFTRPVSSAAQDLMFKSVHSRYLIYNTCWEDPRIDRHLLELDSESRVVMLTSAGCNALDYLLDDPAEVHTVDINPRQNALLDLKLALLYRGNFDHLFALFGNGSSKDFLNIYKDVRQLLPGYARNFWDAKIVYFDPQNRGRSFYYCGAAGVVAWFLSRCVLGVNKRVRDALFDLIDTESLDDQKEIYQSIEPILWGPTTSWVIQQPAVLAMLGVPRPQIDLIRRDYRRGVLGYVSEKIRHVLTDVLITDNYFWRVYLTGAYTQRCCPNYLKAEYFALLNKRCANVHTYNSTLASFLEQRPGSYTHFILLDHQDWLAWHHPDALHEEWELILKNSRPGAKILLRSAANVASFLPDFAKHAVRFYPQRTEPLHQQCRVGTYGSLHFAEVL